MFCDTVGVNTGRVVPRFGLNCIIFCVSCCVMCFCGHGLGNRARFLCRIGLTLYV